MCTLFDLTKHFTSAFTTDLASFYQQPQRFSDTNGYHHPFPVSGQGGHHHHHHHFSTNTFTNGLQCEARCAAAAAHATNSSSWSQLTAATVDNTCNSNTSATHNLNNSSTTVAGIGVAVATSGASNQAKPVQKRTRRRVATVQQRRAANIRERRRMVKLNTAFDRLRKRIPTFAYEKRLSRIETLRLAIMYINFMRDLLSQTPALH